MVRKVCKIFDKINVWISVHFTMKTTNFDDSGSTQQVNAFLVLFLVLFRFLGSKIIVMKV